MTEKANSAQPMAMDYLLVIWQSVVKIFLIDLLGAALVLGVTSLLAVFLYAIAHVIWGLRFPIVAESLAYLTTIYLVLIFAAAIKRHFSLSSAIPPKVGAMVHPNPVPNSQPVQVVDAGIPTSISGS
jgi:predicted neutral ceramidase superfamily lipid hydrolase